MLHFAVCLSKLAHLQAGVTDNVPLHVLGGNIIPVALGTQFMVTEDVRNANISLVVALPAENSTSTGECFRLMALAPLIASYVSWMYLVMMCSENTPDLKGLAPEQGVPFWR